jgi:mRNA deadenylase 3'-5' endonuclease subunit Ccr4
MTNVYSTSEKWMQEFETEKINDFWEEQLLSTGKPTKFKEVISIDFKDLKKIFVENNVAQIKNIIKQLVEGDMLIIKKVLSKDDINQIKNEVKKFRTSEISSFHKLTDGVMNFWRDITEEVSNKYAVPQIKKTSYWFPWDSRSLLIYRKVESIYRILKALGGRHPNEFEKNIPSMGPVDRVQIVEYPAGTGKLEAHHDPSHNQRLIMSGYMSKQGVDFSEGGFWAINNNGEKINLENQLDPGDFGTCYADIVHGVDASNSSGGSRWFIGLYTNDNDYSTNRKTIRPA